MPVVVIARLWATPNNFRLRDDEAYPNLVCVRCQRVVIVLTQKQKDTKALEMWSIHFL